MKTAVRFVLLSFVLTSDLLTGVSLQAEKRPPKTCFCGKPSIAPVVAERLLKHEVKPVIPAIQGQNQNALTPGTVVLTFDISKQGRVSNVKVISGTEALQEPVVAAVRRWRYRPYLLGGDPIMVSTWLCMSNDVKTLPKTSLCAEPHMFNH